MSCSVVAVWTMFIFNFFFSSFFPPIGRLGLFISHQKGSFCFYSVDSVGPRECKDRRERVCVCKVAPPLRGEKEEESERDRGKKLSTKVCFT